MIEILIPVLGRPEKVEPLYRNIVEVTDVPHHVLFLCSHGDRAEIEAVEAVDADYLTLRAPPAKGQYAKKINLGYRETKGEWLALCADDVIFHPHWATTALAAAADRFSVVALNDKANSFVRSGLLATHALVRRSYVDDPGCSLDGPGVIYHEGYSHNFVDCELSVLARKRGVFVYSSGAILRHIHPLFGTTARDFTYDVGLRDFDKDRGLFVSRMTPDYLRDRLVRRFSQAELTLARRSRRRSRNRR